MHIGFGKQNTIDRTTNKQDQILRTMATKRVKDNLLPSFASEVSAQPSTARIPHTANAFCCRWFRGVEGDDRCQGGLDGAPRSDPPASTVARGSQTMYERERKRS